MHCSGETSVDRLGGLLRVGTVVQIDGAGKLHSGKWLVWNVRHRITVDAVSLGFTLARNAIGAPAGGASGLPSLSGGF
jgi:hypothetical protein